MIRTLGELGEALLDFETVVGHRQCVHHYSNLLSTWRMAVVAEGT